MEHKERKQSPVLNPPPQLCPECLTYVMNALTSKKRLDFYFCRHNETLATVKLGAERLSWSLHGPMSAAEVLDLLNDAKKSLMLDSIYEKGLAAWDGKIN